MNVNDLLEGLKISQDDTGKQTIDYSNSGKPDDEYFQGLTKSNVDRKMKKINLNKDDISTEEWDELEQHRSKEPNAYQDILPTYVGMPLYKKAGAKYDSFLDALKKRKEDEITFTDAGLDALMTKNASLIVGELASTYNKFQFYDQVVVVPIASSKGLAKDFAVKVGDAIKKYHSKVRLSPNLFVKKPSAKYGTQLRTVGGRTMTFRPEAYRQLLQQVAKGQISDDEAFDRYEKRVSFIEQRIPKLVQAEQTDQVKMELNALNQEREYLETFFEKLLDKVTDPESAKLVDEPEEMKAVQGFLKRMSYDRFDIPEDTISSQRGEKTTTFIVLVDDNIDTKASLIDAYRVLFKKGVLNTKTRTVAVALHNLI